MSSSTALGDGTVTLTSAAAPVFLDEYSPLGLLVQSVPMPTSVVGLNHRLTASGTAVEGLLSLSADGQYLVATGYDANVATTGVGTSASATVNRVVGLINSAGSVDTTTAINNVLSGNNFRGAVSSNGSDIWISGSAGAVAPNNVAGVSYTTVGSSTATNLISFATRGVSIYGGQLYAGSTSSSSPTVVSQIGTSLPTSATTATSLTGLPISGAGSTNQFAFAHLGVGGSDPDTLYIADDTGVALTKYSLESGTWVAKGTVGSGSDDYTGLTVSVNAGVATLFATRQKGTSADQLVTLTDASGYDGTLTGTPTNLVSAANGTQYSFLGVAFVPVPEPTSLSALLLLGGAATLRRRRR